MVGLLSKANGRQARARRAARACWVEALESRTLLSGTTLATLSLAIVPNTVVGDLGTTFTAAFSGMPAGEVPTGTVSLFEVASAGSTTPMGTLASAVAIDANGVATFTAPGPFTVGPHYYFAQFGGDATFAAENSATATLTVNPKITSTTTLTMAETSPTYGQTVHLTAQVTFGDGSAPGPNAVTLTNVDTGQVVTATSTTASGSASFAVELDSLVSHWVASYAGDATHAASQATLTITAAKAPTTLNVTAGPYGRVVTVDVSLPAGFPTSLLPTFGGVVTLSEGTHQLGQVTLSGTTSAQFVLATLPAGVHHLTASFAGNSFFADSTGMLRDTITKVPTTITGTVLNNGDTLGIHLGLPSDVPPELVPLMSGTVKVYDHKKLVATLTVSGSGDLSLDMTTWRNGLHRLTLVYSGDVIFKGSISASLNFILTPHGEKVPPGFAHAASGLDNGVSSIPLPEDVTAPVLSKKGNGHK